MKDSLPKKLQPILWVIEKIGEGKFPYRLTIKQEDEILLKLKIQDRWPGSTKNIFCIQDTFLEGPGEIIEEVEVLSVRRYGKRMVVVLKREKNKRCEFLFLKKKYKEKEGEYEQIFWRTPQALLQRRPKIKLSPYIDEEIFILIDINERYPWNFPNVKVERVKLPVGDYALKDDKENIVAVVERKTFSNFLSDFGKIHILHQYLSELEVYKYNAVVIEANYSDFFNPKKLKFYLPSFSARAIGEIFAFHPKLNIVFAGNRKLAKEWTLRFFLAVKNYSLDKPHLEIKESSVPYITRKIVTKDYFYNRFNEFPNRFSVGELKKIIPEISESSLRNFLKELVEKGQLIKEKEKNKIFYIKTDIPPKG